MKILLKDLSLVDLSLNWPVSKLSNQTHLSKFLENGHLLSGLLNL